jgi:phage gpG-like protein
MNIDDAKRKIAEKLAEIERFRREDLPEIIGTEAVNHYQQSFINEGKTDGSLQKWQDVKRRNPDSEWYGFSAENKKRFSPTRAQDKILTGDSKELQNAIKFTVKPDRVTIHNDKPYARVHNFGEGAKIFGKKAFKMPARPFIYLSETLNKNIHDKIVRELKAITGTK